MLGPTVFPQGVLSGAYEPCKSRHYKDFRILDNRGIPSSWGFRKGLGFRVWGLGFRVWGLGFRA